MYGLNLTCSEYETNIVRRIVHSWKVVSSRKSSAHTEMENLRRMMMRIQKKYLGLNW